MNNCDLIQKRPLIKLSPFWCICWKQEGQCFFKVLSNSLIRICVCALYILGEVLSGNRRAAATPACRGCCFIVWAALKSLCEPLWQQYHATGHVSFWVKLLPSCSKKKIFTIIMDLKKIQRK